MKTKLLTIRKRISWLPLILVGLLFAMFLGISASKQTAQAAPVTGFEAGRIIDDDVFTNKGSMDVGSIQNFLNSKVPSCDSWGTQPSEFGGGTRAQWGTARGTPPPFTCLKDFSENGQSAAQIIYNAAQDFSINPQVLLVLLQKEQGLVTDTWPTSNQYRTATGYGCPDSTPGVCNSNYYGFTNQVRKASHMFRSILNNSPSWYTPYVLGNNYIQYNPQTSCSGSVVNIENRSTQALYNYTPYQPNQAALNAGYASAPPCGAYGNRNFYLYFIDWFGSTKGNSYYTCRNGANIGGAPSGQKILRNRLPGAGSDALSLTIANNTGTACAEVHTWRNGQLQDWSQHIGTNSYTFHSGYSAIVSATIPGSVRYFKVDYTGTASGRLEVHGWDATIQRWVSHTASVSGTVDPASSEVLIADTDGNSLGETYIVNYANTGSGMVELHGFSPNLQQWSRHTASNLPAIDPTKGRVIVTDLDGNGRDEFTYVKYGDASSSYVEFHTWSPDLQQWVRHTASNLPAGQYNRAYDDIVAADTNGDGRDELYYVKYGNTASGRLEVHGWSGDQQYWTSHVATSSGAF
jgi:hypothetical protein